MTYKNPKKKLLQKSAFSATKMSQNDNQWQISQKVLSAKIAPIHIAHIAKYKAATHASALTERVGFV